MKPATGPSLLALAMLLACLNCQSGTIDYAYQEIVFSAQFELYEEYDENLSLAGQNGWVAYGAGGNGLDNFRGRESFRSRTRSESDFGFMRGQGYIGYDNPDPGASGGYSSVYRPFSLSEFNDSSPIATFRITMEIVDSTSQDRDIFGWTFYTLEEERRPLFSLHFDNKTRLILYALGPEAEPVSTGLAFERDAIYDLEVSMNFVLNRWSATMGESLIAHDLPIASQEAELSLGSVEAFWSIHDLESPGDNYLIFDNYLIARTGSSGPAPHAELLKVCCSLGSILLLSGLPGAPYHLETSLDLESWSRIWAGVFLPIGKDLALEDRGLIDPLRFYRVLSRPGLSIGPGPSPSENMQASPVRTEALAYRSGQAEHIRTARPRQALQEPQEGCEPIERNQPGN